MINKNIDVGLLVLRLTIGGLMLLYGIHKLVYGIGPIKEIVSAESLPLFIAYGVYLGELIAPLLIMVGYRTRLAAVVFAGNMVVAILMVHGEKVFTLTEDGAWGVELVGLYLFCAVALFFTGAGKYALSTKSIWD
jgi:putative oxidoreductase